MKLLYFDSYIETIKKSVDSRVFQTLWAEVENEKKDITESGKKSCALFVSGILKWFNLIEERHATVSGTLKDMEKSDWYKIEDPKEGCVMHWEKAEQHKEPTEHLGFYVGDKKAISNDWKSKTPQKHHWTYGEENGEPKRKIISLYWNDNLNEKYFQ